MSDDGAESADDGSFLRDPTRLAESERIATAPRRLAPKLLRPYRKKGIARQGLAWRWLSTWTIQGAMERQPFTAIESLPRPDNEYAWARVAVERATIARAIPKLSSKFDDRRFLNRKRSYRMQI